MKHTIMSGVAALAVAGITMFGSTRAVADDSLVSARAALDKWVELQQVISKEKRDWQAAQDVLGQRIALLEGEIAAMEGKVAEARSGIEEVDATRRELVARDASFRRSQSALLDVVGRLEVKIGTLVAMTPDALRSRIEPLARRIPANPATTELTLGERFQNVIGILNEVNKFNQDVSVATEVRELPSGGSAEVQTLYLGLGQAYFVTQNGDAAGIGRPTPDGWTWQAADAMAGEIQRAIAILQNEGVPAYVPLSVDIR